MASRDIANVHFFLDLKKKFPHLSDDILRNHIPLFSEDQEKCIRLLQRERHPSNLPFSDFHPPDGASREEAMSPDSCSSTIPQPAPVTRLCSHAPSQAKEQRLPRGDCGSTPVVPMCRYASSQVNEQRTDCGHTVRLSVTPSAVNFQVRISTDPSWSFHHSDESSQAPKIKSAPDPSHILALQNERMLRLVSTLEREKSLCSRLRQEVRRLQHTVKAVKELREENKRLRTECNCLSIETDAYDLREFPPCETEDFYSQIFTGPNGPSLSHSEGQMEDEEWVCEKCTFANHPALAKCEMCEMPKDAFFDGN